MQERQGPIEIEIAHSLLLLVDCLSAGADCRLLSRLSARRRGKEQALSSSASAERCPSPESSRVEAGQKASQVRPRPSQACERVSCDRRCARRFSLLAAVPLPRGDRGLGERRRRGRAPSLRLEWLGQSSTSRRGRFTLMLLHDDQRGSRYGSATPIQLSINRGIRYSKQSLKSNLSAEKMLREVVRHLHLSLRELAWLITSAADSRPVKVTLDVS